MRSHPACVKCGKPANVRLPVGPVCIVCYDREISGIASGAKVRLCTGCHSSAEKTNTLKRVIALSKEGAWICPFLTKECGKVMA
jgi:NMD protein affecting ribosome stability and mRNA decay